MTIAILKLEAGQTIPRPFSRACDFDEARELVGRYVSGMQAKAAGMRYTAERAHTEATWEANGKLLDFLALETETPVLVVDGVSFYAFVEA